MRDDKIVETVVFDLGGVLIDWNPRYLYRKIFDTEDEVEFFLTEVCTPGWNHQMDQGKPFDEAVAELRSAYPRYAREIEAYRDRWTEMLGGQIETSRLLPVLKDRGYPLYALTNWSAETFPVALERYDFLECFEDIVVSGEEGLAKPEEEIFHRLVDRTGLDPASTVFIDDSAANIEAAEHTGFEGILFRGSGKLREDLSYRGLLSA